ncbi:MAG TPA: anthranilate synthase component I, partial [Blastocatellia bacterium]|nr:anthranilate synthase component I [Blastocatellia bacterium]
MSDFETFLAKASSANVAAVVETLPADLLTPLAVYIKLASTAPNSFLLESVEGGESLARYSFIGA